MFPFISQENGACAFFSSFVFFFSVEFLWREFQLSMTFTAIQPNSNSSNCHQTFCLLMPFSVGRMHFEEKRRGNLNMDDRWFGGIAAGAYYLLKMRSLLMSTESTNYVKHRQILVYLCLSRFVALFLIALHSRTHICGLHSQANTVRLSWQRAHHSDKNCFLWHAKCLCSGNQRYSA